MSARDQVLAESSVGVAEIRELLRRREARVKGYELVHRRIAGSFAVTVWCAADGEADARPQRSRIDDAVRTGVRSAQGIADAIAALDFVRRVEVSINADTAISLAKDARDA